MNCYRGGVVGTLRGSKDPSDREPKEKSAGMEKPSLIYAALLKRAGSACVFHGAPSHCLSTSSLSRVPKLLSQQCTLTPLPFAACHMSEKGLAPQRREGPRAC